MSLILDALSRAEREKRASEQGVPDLLSASQPVPRGRSPYLWLFVVVAVLMVAGVLLWFWLAKSTAPPSPAPQGFSRGIADQRAAAARVGDPAVRVQKNSDAAVAGHMPSPSVVGIATPNGSTGHTEPAPGSPAPAVRRDDNVAAAERAAIAALYAAGVEPSADAPRGGSAASISRADTTAEDAANPPAEESPVNLEQILREVRNTGADGGLSEHPVPVLASFSKQFRDRVPTLMYLRHDYASDGQSQVLINGDTLRVGQRSGAVQVVEILPDSVILRLDGEDFRLRALNSWVNL